MTTTRLRGLTRTLGLNPRRRTAPDGGSGPPGDTDAPSIPANLVATAVSSAQIDLTWDASTDNVGVAGYRIYRDNVLVGTSPTNSYSDTGLAPATEYEYEVSAIDAESNESARSAPDSATTPQVIITTGLVAEYRFDAGAGQVLTDYTGNGHHGRLGTTTGADAGDPTWTAQGLSFDGGDVVECDNCGISGTQARTLIVVAKPGGTDANAQFGVEWFNGVSGDLGKRWTMRAAAAIDDMRLEVAGAGYTSSGVINDITTGWQFFAITQSGANINTAVLYKDGLSDPSSVSSVINTAGTLRFGTVVGAGQVMSAAYALVYDRALSAAEVAQNRQALTAILAARGITLP